MLSFSAKRFFFPGALDLRFVTLSLGLIQLNSGPGRGATLKQKTGTGTQLRKTLLSTSYVIQGNFLE